MSRTEWNAGSVNFIFPPSDGRVCARHCPMLPASVGATPMIDRRIKAADFTAPLLKMLPKKQEFFSPASMKLVKIFFLLYISLSVSYSQRGTWCNSRGDSMLYSARNRLRYLKREKSVKNWEKIQQNCDLGWKPGEGNKKNTSLWGKSWGLTKYVFAIQPQKATKTYIWVITITSESLCCLFSDGLIHLIQVYPFNCPKCSNPIWFALQAAKKQIGKTSRSVS